MGMWWCKSAQETVDEGIFLLFRVICAWCGRWDLHKLINHLSPSTVFEVQITHEKYKIHNTKNIISSMHFAYMYNTFVNCSYILSPEKHTITRITCEMKKRQWPNCPKLSLQCCHYVICNFELLNARYVWIDISNNQRILRTKEGYLLQRCFVKFVWQVYVWLLIQAWRLIWLWY